MQIFIISWFLVGFLSIILCFGYDLRGKEFDPDYFTNECIVISFWLFFLGYICHMNYAIYNYLLKTFTCNG